jgi:GNAT superfamily N-acetyltransferase
MEIRSLQESELNIVWQFTQGEQWTVPRVELEDLLICFPESGWIGWSDQHELEPPHPIGTIFAIAYDRMGFIGNVIVEKDFRNRGLGTNLMQHAIQELRRHGLKIIMLDAVSKAVPLYERLGFRWGCKSLRIMGKISNNKSIDSSTLGFVRPISESDWNAIIILDRCHFQADRIKLLRQKWSRYPTYSKVLVRKGNITGFIFAHPILTGIKVGPWITDPTEPHPEMLLHAIGEEAHGASVSLGVLEKNKRAVKICHQMGLMEYAFSNRMIWGEEPFWTAGIYAIGGPDRG